MTGKGLGIKLEEDERILNLSSTSCAVHCCRVVSSLTQNGFKLQIMKISLKEKKY